MATINAYLGSGAHGGAPGVRFEDSRPSRGRRFRSGVPLFIGFARLREEDVRDDGPHGGRTAILESWQHFEPRLEPMPGSFLGHAVRGFFQNGGERCVVLPVAASPHARTPVSSDAFAAEPLGRMLYDLFKKDDDGVRGVLDDIDDVDLVCAPDIMIEEIRESLDSVFVLQQQVLEYCHDMGERLAILDALPGDPATIRAATKAAIQHWQGLTAEDGTLYFPWVSVPPLHGDGPAWVPPCGHVAGIYARSDARVGVHKAPANEIVDGVLDLQIPVTEALQARLNEAGVNSLRSFARRGIRLWGARTLSVQRQWRYVNVRRIYLTLIRWIKHNMDDLAFEPNTPQLWDRIVERLGGFCYELFRDGALKGIDPEEGFFLKCDAETNPLDEREAGRVVCEIGLAPGAPAEFIVIRVTRTAGGIFGAAPSGG